MWQNNNLNGHTGCIDAQKDSRNIPLNMNWNKSDIQELQQDAICVMYIILKKIVPSQCKNCADQITFTSIIAQRLYTRMF